VRHPKSTRTETSRNGLRRRILFVVNETYFFMTHRLPVARALLASGWEVHVAAPDDHVWAPVGFTVETLKTEGFHYHRIPLSRRGRNPFQEVRTLLSLWHLLRRLRPDMLHLLTIKPVIYGGLVARVARIPSVVSTITGLGQMFVEAGLATAMIRSLIIWLYRFALAHPNSRVIVQNSHDADVLIDAGAVDRQRVRLIRGSGVNLDDFTPTATPQGTTIVVLPARLIWEKGVGEFVAAAELLQQRECDARLALIGDTQKSNPRAVPRSQIEAWVANGTIEWWGRRTDMPEVFAQSAIVCLPTTYGEGVPKVLLEAAAAGRPIIASDIPGCREIVRHGENGILVPRSDPQALADAIFRLVNDHELRTRMGERGRKIAESDFGEAQVVEQTLGIYGEIMPASSP